MKILILIVLGGILIQCKSEPVAEPVQTEVSIEKEINLLEFSDYKFRPKDTLFKTLEFGIQKQIIDLGMYSTDSMSYEVVAEFRLIPGLEKDSPRGRSSLFLINEYRDTLMFDAGMPEDLPIDIYKNHFVFIDESGEFLFETIHVIHIEEHMLCFKGRACFM